jgi:hypothetical protein
MFTRKDGKMEIDYSVLRTKTADSKKLPSGDGRRLCAVLLPPGLCKQAGITFLGQNQRNTYSSLLSSYAVLTVSPIQPPSEVVFWKKIID